MRPHVRWSAATGAGVTLAVVIGAWWGVLPGAVAIPLAARLLRDLPSAAVRAEQARLAADLPLAADLLAAALRAGAPVAHAADAVADALDGPLALPLRRVARALGWGAGPAEAWGHLAVAPGAQRLIDAAVRASANGGALAGVLARIADDLRADRRIAVESAGQRAGVLIVLPLGLCFLPAFVLAGLVPVVAAVLSTSALLS
ncbi:hypothetical protein GCM10010124_11640 [Pilimelia terevasa]|uniref:Type II secretion system protein GspF domain-containing protein n=1 Tax=Pilimelia terevasa TaxID=53372 RepID=A0A8J3FFK7_9ACTN|nr:type II secretion system F family protein [Pilimelia terevasa]GGK20776.1 hypothetical protein GCM10010124_11640 [Pilimelia terevasa]